MTRKLTLGVGVMLALTVIVTTSRTGVANAGSHCGDLVAWKISHPLIEHHPTEPRDYATLQTQARINLIKLAAEKFCRVNAGQYPRSIDDLVSPPSAVRARLGKCVVDSLLTNDAWNRAIRYSVAAYDTVSILSSGSDMLFGTADDIGLPVAGSQFAATFDLSTECLSSVSDSSSHPSRS